MLVPDAQQNKGGQAFWVGFHTVHTYPLTRQLLADKAAHMFIADPLDQPRFQPQPRRARRHIGGRAADIFLE